MWNSFCHILPAFPETYDFFIFQNQSAVGNVIQIKNNNKPKARNQLLPLNQNESKEQGVLSRCLMRQELCFFNNLILVSKYHV